MLDFDPSELLRNPLLVFYDSANRDTGAVRDVNSEGNSITPRRIAHFNGLKFTIYDTGLTFIEGSLHVYWNNGEHNFNDFSEDDFKTVLNEICEKFNLSKRFMKINQLEIGVNIKPPIETERVLRGLFSHGKKVFKDVFCGDEGNYRQCEHNQYYVKVYDKRLHYQKKGFPLEFDILRIEIKYRGIERLKRFGIVTMLDLEQKGLKRFKKVLKKEFDDILYFDDTITSRSNQVLKYSNPNYWKDYYKTDRQSAYSKHKGKLKEMILKDSQNIKGQIVKLIGEKVDSLTSKGASFKPLCISSNPIPSKHQKKCLVTGLNISMQREDSKLLSHSGLKYYASTDSNIFKELKSKYLSSNWATSTRDKQIKEIAHVIRSKHSYEEKKKDLCQLVMF